MAELVTSGQQLATALGSPLTSYSRVVSCVAYMKGALGAGYGYTGLVGQTVWLRSVRVWFAPKSWPVDNIYFRIVTGTAEPTSINDMYGWTNVLPLLQNGAIDWSWMRYAEFDPMEWTMCQLYEGQGRRFGVYFTCGGTITLMYLMVSFEISEG